MSIHRAYIQLSARIGVSVVHDFCLGTVSGNASQTAPIRELLLPRNPAWETRKIKSRLKSPNETS